MPEARRVRYTLEEKPRPLAVTVNPPLPAGRTFGERELRTGLTITAKLLVSGDVLGVGDGDGILAADGDQAGGHGGGEGVVIDVGSGQGRTGPLDDGTGDEGADVHGEGEGGPAGVDRIGADGSDGRRGSLRTCDGGKTDKGEEKSHLLYCNRISRGRAVRLGLTQGRRVRWRATAHAAAGMSMTRPMATAKARGGTPRSMATPAR